MSKLQLAKNLAKKGAERGIHMAEDLVSRAKEKVHDKPTPDEQTTQELNETNIKLVMGHPSKHNAEDLAQAKV